MKLLFVALAVLCSSPSFASDNPFRNRDVYATDIQNYDCTPAKYSVVVYGESYRGNLVAAGRVSPKIIYRERNNADYWSLAINGGEAMEMTEVEAKPGFERSFQAGKLEIRTISRPEFDETQVLVFEQGKKVADCSAL